MTDKPFNMTVRRREVLWHIAYSDEIKVEPLRLPRYGWKEVQNYRLCGVSIDSIVRALRSARLIRWRPFGWIITPKGAEALWAPPNP